MIPETFLLCALAVQPAFVGHPSWRAIQWVSPDDPAPTVPALFPPIKFLDAFLLSTDFLDYQARKVSDTQGRSLFISGHSVPMVQNLRDYGFKAFGLVESKYQETTRWHAVGNWIPFLPESFLIVYYLNPIFNFSESAVSWKDILKDQVTVIEQGGFFVFKSTEDSALWETMLKEWGWTLLPIKILDLSIWQKPYALGVGQQLKYWIIKHRGGFSPIGSDTDNGKKYGEGAHGHSLRSVDERGTNRVHTASFGSSA